MSEWIDLDKNGLPKNAGRYLCVLRGMTDIRLMKYIKNGEDGFRWVNSNGLDSRKVTHYFEVPSLPPAIQMNILLKKATDDGLSEDEKIELSDLLRAV